MLLARALCASTVLAAATLPAAAQLRWVQRDAPTHPPTTLTGFVYADNPMTYDSDRRVCVWTNTVETWEWDGVSWTNRPHAPLPVYAGLGITYDSARHRTVLISYASNPLRLMVWEWDGTAWTLRTEQGGPTSSGRVEFVVQYDPVQDVILLVGGQNTIGGVFLDTWQLSGTTWTQVGSAPVFTGHAMAYDTARSTMILYGPQPGSGGITYDRPNPTSWTSRVSGPNRLDGSVVADAARGRAVLFGGLLSFGVPSGETWEYDGTAWTQLAIPGPSPRRSVAMAYDSHRDVIVLFGGMLPPNGTRLTDTWELSFCPADFNHDGAANSQDFFDFLTPFFAADTAADFNHDGTVNSQDFFDFVTAFFGGCA